MKLIGMLDSPYVRRVAISLQRLELPFEHASISVFRGYDAFRQINPVVKAPTLVTDDGTVLMDSTLILEYAEALARPRTLMPREPAALARALHRLGLALAATEKSVQLVYELKLRPADKQHAPWRDRVTAQLRAALALLEAEVGDPSWPAPDEALDQAGLTLAVAWTFASDLVPGLVPDVVTAEAFPRLAAYAAAAERLPAFRAAPHGDGTYPVTG